MNDVSSRRLRMEQTSPSDELTRIKPIWSSDFWWLFAVGLITVALCAPFIRYVWFLGDEGVLLHGAERMLRGDTIYVDFFEFLPPGGFIIIEGWFGLAGVSLFSARALAILTIAGSACFTYLACRQASKDAPLSALIAVGWVIVSQGPWTQVSHHWFTTLFSMMAAWITLASVAHARRWLGGLFTAGIAAGAAVMVTPHRGALAMVAGATAFLNLRRYRAELVSFVLGCALVPICVFAYLIAHGALKAAFDDAILFTATGYNSVNGDVPWGQWAGFHLKWIFPLTGVIALLACVRDWRNCLQDRVFRTCVAFGLAGFAGCFPRPDTNHIGFSAPLVCPLLAYCVNRLIRPWPAKYWYAAAAVAIASLIPSARGLWLMSEKALYGDIAWMPRGGITSPVYIGMQGLAARIAATPSGDAYFFYPYDAFLPFLAARRQLSKYDIFVPGYTLPSQYQEACVSVMRSASWAVIDREWTDPKFLTNIFPSTRDPEPKEKKLFERALETGFELVAREGVFELRRRAPAADEALCAGMTD